VKIGLIDGPVAINHPELASDRIKAIPGNSRATCIQTNSAACMHGTFVAGILSAKRGSIAPAVCPNCTLMVRPIFTEITTVNGSMPSATLDELAQAIFDCVDARVRILNVSAAIVQPTNKSQRSLKAALDHAARRGVIVIVAAGNQGTLGSTTITSHPWVVPVVAYDLQGKPMHQSNLGRSIGRRGLGAPGAAITSLGSEGKSLTFSGTSAAAPFVTGAVALLWSEFPNASAADIKLAITQPYAARRNTVVPPLLNAWTSYQSLLATNARRQFS
jgi:subtilisin family serine protease